MTVEIHRTYLNDATAGVLIVNNESGVPVFSCMTLELPWRMNAQMISCIPEGTYEVWKMKPTEKRKYEYFWVKNVPGRDSILFHPGNYTSQIQGCILPGDYLKDLNKDGTIDVCNTTATLKKLTTILPDSFQLTIKKK
jgi:hypothetical protein